MVWFQSRLQRGPGIKVRDLSSISMCSSSHKVFLKKKEEDNCAGAVAFGNVVCSDYFHCTLNDGRPASECRPKICEKFKAMPRNNDCFRSLFVCN
ncbi:hypothetical protein ANCCAN_04685 [Ancylostoma caninum]|uniref:Uncharacterized protein n=1 Tax=Ancylostoma caninum TaxID=29170 RepID=A0A368H1Y2_ANCCA|nr:hypothetical protein ANCCAN_04685 [Ancylostoma caninum]